MPSQATNIVRRFNQSHHNTPALNDYLLLPTDDIQRRLHYFYISCQQHLFSTTAVWHHRSPSCGVTMWYPSERSGLPESAGVVNILNMSHFYLPSIG